MPDLMIIGGGPAGLSAAIYAARAGLNVITAYQSGGALQKTDKIENYFGFPEPISGGELLARGRAQAERLGVKLIQAEVIGFGHAEKGFVIKTLSGSYDAGAAILATGVPRTAPPVAGLVQWEGRGLSYCAVCDAFFYRGKPVAVLGEGEYALEEAKTLLPIASSVTLLTNGAPVPAALPDGLLADTRRISSVGGGDRIEHVAFTEGDPLAVSGLFAAYGTANSTDFARKLGAFTEGNRIRVDASMATNIPGLFAAGDCVGGLLQIAKAVSDGAQAAMSAAKYLRG